MSIGKTSGAMRILDPDFIYSKVLCLDDTIENVSVRDILDEKHPASAGLVDDAIVRNPYMANSTFHPVIFEAIDADCIIKEAKRTMGAAGPSGVDALSWRKMLTLFGRDSRDLADALAYLARKVAGENLHPSNLKAFRISRLIALNKSPGVRPIGVGEVFRRIISKSILRLITKYVQSVSSNVQLCAGQRSGIEYAVHSVREAFQLSSSACILTIDASNAFNRINRKNALASMINICPALSTTLNNTYCEDPVLSIGDELKSSREGFTQGDPLSMIAFAAASIPLIRELQRLVPNAFQRWYADDVSFVGSLDEAFHFFEIIKRVGPKYGFYVNPNKCKLLTKDRIDSRDLEKFSNVNIQICEDGIELLGSFIGSVDYVRDQVISRVSKWSVMLERLVEIALFDPQCALSAYTFAFQHSWTHLVRTCECEERLFQPLEYIFVKKFLPALTGLEYIPPELRETISLPYGKGGLGLVIIGKDIGIQYERSGRVSGALGCYADINKVKEAQSMMLREIRSEVGKYVENKRATLELKLESVQLCALRYASEKGASSWLTMRPLDSKGYHLSSVEFRDALAMRFGWTPVNVASHCVCGESINVLHSLSCRHGGLTIVRHNIIRDVLASTMKSVCDNVCIEPVLAPVTDESVLSATTCRDMNARLDIACTGIFGNRWERSLMDVSIFNVFAPSYVERVPSNVYAFHENRKRAKYVDRVSIIERGTFIPLIFSVFGGAGKSASGLLKKVAALMSNSNLQSYADNMTSIRRTIAVALNKTNSACFRKNTTEAGTSNN